MNDHIEGLLKKLCPHVTEKSVQTAACNKSTPLKLLNLMVWQQAISSNLAFDQIEDFR